MQAILCTLCLIFCSNLVVVAQIQQKDLEKNYEKAIKSFEKNNFAEGYEYLQKCLQIDSLWRDALYAKAFFELEEEKYLASQKSFSKLLLYYPTDTAAYLGRARAYSGLSLFQQAVADVQRVLQMDSTHTQALSDMGFVYAQAGFPKKAQEFLDKALQKEPKNSQILQLKSYAFWLDKDLEKAEEFAKKALQYNPENIEAQKLLAYIAYDKEKFAETIKIFEAILKKNKYAFDEDDFYYWSMAYYKLKNYKKAVSIAQSIEKHSNPNLYYVQALCYFKSKQYPSAWDLAEIAEQIGKDMPAEFYYDKAIFAHYVGKKDEAKRYYATALSIMPELFLQKNDKDEKADVVADASPLLHKQFQKAELDSLLVLAYQERCLDILQEDQKQQAIKDINKALTIDSLNSRSYTIKGIVEAMQGNFQEANRLFERAEKLPRQRDLGYLYLMRGLAAAEAENFGQALYYLDKAISQNPQAANYYAEKAHILFENDSIDEALENINKAIRLKPKDVDFRLEKIGYLYADERFDEVLKECNETLKINPDAVEVYFYSGMSHWAKQNTQQARKDLEYFLVYYPDDQEATKALKSMK
jgi:tetratricopeptide (TPR) repeat protein